MTNSNELAVILPAYNEEAALPGVIDKWTAVLDSLGMQYQMHVYDDGSKDNTRAVLESLAVANPKVTVHSKPNSGHGPTILQGYRENCETPFILQIDSDDEIEPSYFRQFWNQRDIYDFQIGRRRYENRSGTRAIISLISRIAVRILYGRGVYDVNCQYRLMRGVSFRQLFASIPANTFAPNVIVSGYACFHKMRINQLDVKYKFRSTGQVSIKHFKLLRSAIRSFMQTIRFRTSFLKKGV
jgi:dolichol-phosphate mannosyltransferase